MTKRIRITILKFAAIGDVTMACRAIADICTKYTNLIEIDWIIDQHLANLAKTILIQQGTLEKTTIRWHTINAKNLFRGNALERAHETFQILRAIKRAKPTTIAILHRDWRYKAVVRAIFKGKLVSAKKTKEHEITEYFSTIERAIAFYIESRDSSPILAKPPKNEAIAGIGILVGGAQNQKGAYREKRWPHFKELIKLILENTTEQVLLFGGQEDVLESRKIVTALENENVRIVNYCGQKKLEELPVLLSKIRIFISVDSGLAHIAAISMNRPEQKIITLFGPTNPTQWKPLASGAAKTILITENLDCAPCYKEDGNFQTCKFTGIDFQKCMTQITPTQILNEIINN